MIELTPSKAIPIIADLLMEERPRPRAITLIGAPGMGKTASVEQAVEEVKRRGRKCIMMDPDHPLLKEPIDYTGLPWVVQADGKAHVEQLPMAFVREAIETATANPEALVVLFFDDVGQAPGSTQGALAQFAEARQFAGQKLPDNIRVIFATNRRKDKAGVTGFLSMLTRRVTVIGMTNDIDAWSEYALKRGLPPELVAYARFKPDSLHDSETLANKDIEPFCNPACLESVGWHLNAGVDHLAVIAGDIGESRATEVVSFLRVWRDLPDIDEVLANPAKAKVPASSRPDVLYALTGALAVHVDAKRMANLCIYLDRLPVEYQVVCIKDAEAQKPELRKTKALMDWLFRNRVMLGLGDAKENE